MYTYLETGELLKHRKCGTDAWCTPTATEGLIVGCAQCDEVLKGARAEAMCFEQRFYVEAGRYKEQVKKAGSSDDIPIPESVKKFKEKLPPGDRESYPLCFRLQDPNWPFHY